MAVECGDDTRGSLEAACNSLIDIESISSKGELDNHRNASKLNTEKYTLPFQDISERVSTKDTNEDKYIDQANLHRASQMKRETDAEDDTQSAKLQQNDHKDSRKEEKLPVNKTSKSNSETEKEEGNYEDLICLVRQFYVERPVNPAAIGYQNMETC